MNWLTQPLTWPDGAALNAAWRNFREVAWREWAMWPVQRLVASAIGLFTCSALCVWLLWPNSGQEVEALTQSNQALQTQLQSERERFKTLKAQTALTPGAIQAGSSNPKDWPAPDQVQFVLMTLYLQAQQQGLQMELFKPDRAHWSQGFTVQPLHLRLHGSFAQIVAWNHAVFHMNALWLPEKWILTAQPGAPSGSSSSSNVSLEALLHLYLQPEAGPSPQNHAVDRALGPAAKPESAPLFQSDSLIRFDPFSRPAPRVSELAATQPEGDDAPPLRRWPLEKLIMVGSLTSAGALFALVQTPAGLFRVSLGDVLGSEGAKVVRLEAQQLFLSLPAKQQDGRWTERSVTLPIRPVANP
jgi:Tfp pilus assembly protein PilP/Tfp pilus assembly protein PilO